MFYNSINKKQNKPIAVVILVEGLMQSVYEVEKKTGLSLNTTEVLEEIIKCVDDKNTAQLELEMCGLDMMEKHSFECNDEDNRIIINFFVKTGMKVLSSITQHGLYRDDRLKFFLGGHFLDNIVLMEITSDMIEMLNEEFNDRSHRLNRFSSLSTTPRLLSGFI